MTDADIPALLDEVKQLRTERGELRLEVGNVSRDNEGLSAELEAVALELCATEQEIERLRADDRELRQRMLQVLRVLVTDCEGTAPTLDIWEAVANVSAALIEQGTQRRRDNERLRAENAEYEQRVSAMLPYVRLDSIFNRLLRRPLDAPLGEGATAWYVCCDLCKREWPLDVDAVIEKHADGCIAAPLKEPGHE